MKAKTAERGPKAAAGEPGARRERGPMAREGGFGLKMEGEKNRVTCEGENDDVMSLFAVLSLILTFSVSCQGHAAEGARVGEWRLMSP